MIPEKLHGQRAQQAGADFFQRLDKNGEFGLDNDGAGIGDFDPAGVGFYFTGQRTELFRFNAGALHLGGGATGPGLQIGDHRIEVASRVAALA